MPEVHVDLKAVVVQDPEALERVQERTGCHGEGPLHQGLIRVIGDVKVLIDGVDHVRHGDGDAVVPLR